MRESSVPASRPQADATPAPPPTPEGGAETAAAVEASATLRSLRELISLAAEVRPTVARRAGMTPTELHALELLSTGERGPGELARALGVTTAASSGVVDRLVRRGHVVREPDESDGRRTRVTMTDSGQVDVRAHLMPMFLALREVDERLDPAEREVVDAYLRGAVEAVRRLL